MKSFFESYMAILLVCLYPSETSKAGRRIKKNI